MTVNLYQGDCLEVLSTLPTESVQCVVTSPPYYGLRDYGVDGQIGLEKTPDEYVNRLVSVFREVRRVLKDDGTLFLNLGDSYYSNPGNGRGGGSTLSGGKPHLSGAQRVKPYGTSGKAPANYQDHDCLCESLCDACRRAYRIGKSHNGIQLDPKLIVSLSETNRAHKELQIDHLPTLDLGNQEGRNGLSIQDLMNIQDREDAPLPASLVSTTDEFFRQSQDNNLAVSNLAGVCQLCGRSFVRSSPVSSRKSGDYQEQGERIHDNALSGDQLAHHNQYKDTVCEYCNENDSYRYYTTEYHLKPKDLIGIPWRVAFALQADGWWLRQDIIWAKPNPMPESVTDRCTKAHEYIFLLTKSARYYYDNEAVKEPFTDERNGNPGGGGNYVKQVSETGFRNDGATLGTGIWNANGEHTGRNRRSVWTVSTTPYKGAHFATFPPKLIEPCILAGSKPGDTILDPFNGSGTTGQVAIQFGRNYIGIELNPEYLELTKKRLAGLDIVLPMEVK